MRREISETYKEINNWLKKQGRTPDGRPLFKLVWSDNEIEPRHGTFEEFYGAVFIRRVTGTRLVPKYNYISERWVLEKWFPIANPELPNSFNEGTYEPFWVFSDRHGGYLDATMKVVQFLVGMTQRAVRVSSQERASQMKEEDNKALESEIQEFMAQIDVSEIGYALRQGEGIGYTKEMRDK